MYRRTLCIVTLITLGLVSSISANEILNWSFERPGEGQPVSDWIYEGGTLRTVKVEAQEPHCGDYVGRSLAAWYGHDEPDGHLYQIISAPECGLEWADATAGWLVAFTGKVKRYVLDGGYTNHPDWGWVTVELTADDDIIWSETFDADDTWHLFQFMNSPQEPIFVEDYLDVHIRWGTEPGVGTKSFDVLLLDCFALWKEPVPEPATIALLGLGGLALLRKRR